MTIKPGDKIKIRSWKSIVNEFDMYEFNDGFAGWGQQVIYLGVIEYKQRRGRVRISVSLSGLELKTDSRCVERWEDIVFV